MKKAKQETPASASSWRDAIPQQGTRRATTDDGDAATRERRWRRLASRCALGLTTLVALVVVGWLWQTRSQPAPAGAYLPVHRVEVFTDGVLDADWVRETAAKELSAGLLHVDVHQLRDTLLAHPQVLSATIRLEVPTTIWVTLTERQPAFLTRVAGVEDPQRWRYVTAEGWVYNGVKYTRQDLAALPFVTGFSVSDFSRGEALVEVIPEVKQLHELAEATVPRLARDWLVYDVSKAAPGPGANSGLIEVTGREIAQITFARANVGAQLARLREIEMWRASTATGPLARVDLSFRDSASIFPHAQP